MGQAPYHARGEFRGSVDSEVMRGTCRHEDARCIGDGCQWGCCDLYECPTCGRRFVVEVPD